MKTRIPPARTVHGRPGRASEGGRRPGTDPLAEAFGLHQAGRLQEARQRYEALLAQRPQDAAVLRLLGAAMCQLGEAPQGRDYLRQSLALEPDHVETLINFGKVSGQLQALPDAARAFARAAQLEPGNADAHFCQATIASDGGQHPQALGHYSQVLALDPSHQGAWRGAGFSAMQLGQAEDALGFYDQALRLRPDDLQSRCNRGALLAGLGRYVQSLADFSAAVDLDPGHAVAWNNRALALKELGYVDEAISSADRAVALDPAYADAWSNRGNIQLLLGKPRAALADYERAIALDPGHKNARFNLSMVLMQVGRLSEGLALYEERRQRGVLQINLPPERQWLGDKPLAGKRLLISMEQGLGDMLQFCRYALLARERGAEVVIQAPPTLLRLLRTLGPGIDLVPVGEPVPDIHMVCPLMSLPHAFRTELDTIPAPIPYLHAEPGLAARWRERLAAGPQAAGFRVGLVWSGGFRQDQPELWSVNLRRNVPLELLAPLRMPGARFISLQKGADSEAQLQQLQAEGWGGPAIEDYTADLGDFADTAALIENLDLVISVDTSTAHLAAAMGKPTWVLSRLDGCWRWLEDRDDSPWYPTLRLYRQTGFAEWEPVVERVRADLARLIEGKGARA